MDIEFDQYTRSIDRDDGVVSLEEAKDIIRQYIDGQKEFCESDEEPFAVSLFAFRKAWYDYLEISIMGKQDLRITFACRYTKRFFKFTYRSSFMLEYKVPAYSDLVHLVRLYYSTPTEQYKEIYSRQRYKKINTY